MSSLITQDHREQFKEEGYFILENAIPDKHMSILDNACDHLIKIIDDEFDAQGITRNHITHKGVRYHIAKRYEEYPPLKEYIFSDLMEEVCKSTIGETAYLFYDQYVVKCAEKGISFSWHQDSGYLGFPHVPYVTTWACVDDMSLENGTAFVMPFSTIGIKSLVEHILDPTTGDKVGYFGKEEGVPVIAKAGSLAVFSSLSFHRSGANTTNKMRRAYVTQYAPAVICRPGETEPMHLAVPFLKDGQKV